MPAHFAARIASQAATATAPSPGPSLPQLAALAPGPYLQQLEELRLDGNLLLHPLALPPQLLEQRRLRRLVLPLYWQLVSAADGLPALLLALMPWLQLEHL